MIEIKGKYNTAKCFVNEIEESARKQIQELCDKEIFKDNKIRVMPDVHAGKGCTIGTTMTLTNERVVPAHVGVDIGCGVTGVKLKNKKINFKAVQSAIEKNVPSGFNIHNKPHKIITEAPDIIRILMNLRFIWDMDEKQRGSILDRAMRSVGTLGGGNHFIEIDKSDDGDLLLVVHSGSRQLGQKCCNYYEKLAKSNRDEDDVKELISYLKANGREKEIQNILETMSRIKPKKKEHLSGLDYADYIHDMELIQQYALINRMIILKEILDTQVLEYDTENPLVINSTHNYIDLRDKSTPTLRKGAISARKGEEVIIPLNMRDGLIVAKGLGNPDWNYSAPHGAGRVMSRREAHNNLKLSDYVESMEGIYTDCLGYGTIDEAPMVYKKTDQILSNILDKTITDVKRYKPVFNYKSNSENDSPWRVRTENDSKR